MAYRVFVLGLLLTAALAGCLEPKTTDDGTDLPTAVATHQQAPQWQIGQWWTYNTSWWGAATLVVFEDRDEDWFVATSNEELSWHNERDGISFLDMVRKSDLAGTQFGGYTQYFDFPLEEGKTWNTTWTGDDPGENRRIEVMTVNETVHLHGYHDDGWHAISYDYDPRAGWFTRLALMDEDHEITFEMDLVDHGTGFLDEVAVWETAAHGGFSAMNTPVGNVDQSFTVPSGVDDLVVQYEWECDTQEGQLFFAVVPVPPSPGSGETVDHACVSIEETVFIADPEPGDWRFQGNFISAPGTSSFIMERFTRTLDWVPVADASGDNNGNGNGNGE